MLIAENEFLKNRKKFFKALKFSKRPPIYITSKANEQKFNAYAQCNLDLTRTIREGLQ